ncbi:MAG TPA: GNAT family N-acetyltransferase [Roseiflexaceae bacterium]|nr:GNAT family N-acetyltransferase [Roseiflexaceae bacterium]
MAIQSMDNPAYRRDLGGGLVLRWSTAADMDAIGQLYGFVFRGKPEEPLNASMMAWERDLISGRHPLIGSGDFALVEDTDGGAIVAATCLLRQTWEYEGIAFPVGRPEIVATLPEFRNRGLIRAIFELIHARSDGEGHLAQGITGISYYYRQFGYEYAIDLDAYRSVYLAAIPKLKEGEAEPYALRDATPADLPRVMELYDRGRAHGPVSTRIDADYWRWVLDGQNPNSGEGWRTQLIVRAGEDHPALGYVLTSRWRWGDSMGVRGLAVDRGVALPPLAPSLLRALQAQALTLPALRPTEPEVVKISFVLATNHPLYGALGPQLTAGPDRPYAWYVRVPDLPRLIRRIAPALERRLAASSSSGYSGDLTLNFYRSGLRLAFEQGRLMAAEDFRAEGWRPQHNAGFPPLVFLQLLFGRRSLAELRHAFPDVWADDIGRPLLEALFPARPSWVLPLD